MSLRVVIALVFVASPISCGKSVPAPQLAPVVSDAVEIAPMPHSIPGDGRSN